MENNQYIPFGVNHSADDNLVALIEAHGMEGYGIYIALLFELRKRTDYLCALRSLAALARRWEVDLELLTSVVNDFALFGFVLKTDADITITAWLKPNHFFSHYLNEVMGPLEHKRLLLSEAGKLRAITAERAADGRFTSLVQQVEKSKAEQSKTEQSKVEQKKSKAEQNKKRWELLLDGIFREQSWVEMQAMHSGMRQGFMEQLADILDFFKSHVRTYGKEDTILSDADAKSYFSNFIRQGSATRKALDGHLQKQQRSAQTHNPYRYEQRDPASGARSYCGRQIPTDAPPRPNENAVWSQELGEWA